MVDARRLRWVWLTLAVVLLDRATKAWIESRPNDYFPHVVIAKVFNIVNSRNPGIAFSVFANSTSPWVRVGLIGVSVVIIAIMAWLLVTSRRSSAWNAAGFALLLGGATGNLTDRIVHGAVTDFLEVWLRFLPWQIFNPWPTFNVADAGVTAGAILVVIDVLFRPGSTRES
jgi:signal peptidase II